MKRFEIAYQNWFYVALAEIRQGRKQSNWMSYIFPQIYGLRKFESENSYSICSKQQAIAFLEHHTLGKNFRNICTELLNLQENDIIAKATTYHCESIIEALSDDCFKVCKILSDADALDRCRFHNDHARLNINYLHFEESLLCITPIDFICKESVRQDKITNEIPFEEFLKLAEF